MMKKKVVSILLSAALAVSLAACGNSSQTGATEERAILGAPQQNQRYLRTRTQTKRWREQEKRRKGKQ